MSYKTNDIVLAATLKVLGNKLINIEIVGNKGNFIFDDIQPNIITEYALGKILVEPVIFNNTIKQLTTSVRKILQ